MEFEVKEKAFIAQAFEVFKKYGIKSVTMNDMARHLGMSKKTIYNYVKDKNDLVKKTLIFQCEAEQMVFTGIRAQNHNAIDEMFKIGQFISTLLKELHPSIHYDLEKYHNEVFEANMKMHEANIYSLMISNLNKGVAEGLYRKDLNADVISKIYLKKMDVVFDSEVFDPGEISFEEVYAIMFRYHILGVASAKGVTYLNKKFKKNKSNSL